MSRSKKILRWAWFILVILYLFTEVLYALMAGYEDRRYVRKARRWVGRDIGSTEPQRWLE